MRKGWKQLTKEEFENMKLLQSAGLKAGMVVKVTKRSGGTVSNVFRCNTFKDYQQFNRNYRETLDNSKKDSLQTVPPMLVEVPNEPPVIKSNGNSDLVHELKQINITLTRLCMAWENNPSKKGWLK